MARKRRCVQILNSLKLGGPRYVSRSLPSQERMSSRALCSSDRSGQADEFLFSEVIDGNARTYLWQFLCVTGNLRGTPETVSADICYSMPRDTRSIIALVP